MGETSIGFVLLCEKEQSKFLIARTVLLLNYPLNFFIGSYLLPMSVSTDLAYANCSVTLS